MLNDYVELSEYPQLYDPAYAAQRSAASSGGAAAGASDASVLKIVPDFYDERAARIHVRRCVACACHQPSALCCALTSIHFNSPHALCSALLCSAACCCAGRVTDCVTFW